ncbi:MAG: DUF368 domain-containing protein [Vicingaceae bacterium]
MNRILLILKGMAMGAADVVPGVSGGTIAFISGIYEELIESIRSIDVNAFKLLFKKGPIAFWETINGNFLFSVFLGIGISVLGLSKLISYLLENEPVLLWSFFFGLILISIFSVGGQINQWKKQGIAAIILGCALSYYVSIATPMQGPESTLVLFFYGFIAIIAMILPGISGAFILLLLGAYSTIIQIVNSFRTSLTEVDLASVGFYGFKLLVFMAGCLAGLLAFSRVLSWMFKHYRDTTLALLTGFMIGSLNKIWPWKETIESRVAHAGKENEAIVPFIQENVWPWNYDNLNDVEKMLSTVPDKNPEILAAVMVMTAGATIMLILDKYSPDNE